jgi:hypothetical protein
MGKNHASQYANFGSLRDNGFAASFTISIFNVLIATFLFSNGVKIELC